MPQKPDACPTNPSSQRKVFLNLRTASKFLHSFLSLLNRTIVSSSMPENILNVENGGLIIDLAPRCKSDTIIAISSPLSTKECFRLLCGKKTKTNYLPNFFLSLSNIYSFMTCLGTFGILKEATFTKFENNLNVLIFLASNAPTCIVKAYTYIL